MSLLNDEDNLVKYIISINGTHKDFNQDIRKNWSAFLEDFQRLHSDANRARQEIANLEQKLGHARRNLEEEKRKRRAIEQQRDLLESYIDIAQRILFDNEETNLNKAMKEKLQFLNKITVKKKQNNLHVRDMQNDGQSRTVTEMDSTGSILSDLNCLSKSDDSDINIILIQKQREWKKHKPSCEYSKKKQCSTLDKVAEFNSLDKVTTVKSNNDIHTPTSLQTQIGPVSKTVDSKMNTKKPANHNFTSKMILKPETCIACGKRIRFGKIILICKDCSIICHIECKLKILHPCIDEGIAMLCDFTKK